MQKSGLMAAAALIVAGAHAENGIETDGLNASPNSVRVGAVMAYKAGCVVVHDADQNGMATADFIGLARIRPVTAGSKPIQQTVIMQ